MFHRACSQDFGGPAFVRSAFLTWIGLNQHPIGLEKTSLVVKELVSPTGC
jgi:hypothetical protein